MSLYLLISIAAMCAAILTLEFARFYFEHRWRQVLWGEAIKRSRSKKRRH